MKALITGASGCLGRALVSELTSHGWTLRTTARRTVELPGFVAADLVQDELSALVDGVDAVFHCAAMSGGWGSPDAFHAANVTATERLLHAADKAGCCPLCLCLHPQPLCGWDRQVQPDRGRPLPERALSPYADSKRQAETLVLAQNGAMRCTAIRPRAIYGLHDRALLPRLCGTLERGILPLISGGRAQVDLTHRSDAARAMRLAAGGPGGRVWNITSGEAFSFRQLAEMVCVRGNYKPRRIPLPYGLAYTLAGLAERGALLRGGAEPTLTRQAVVSLGRSLTLDISAARRDLGYCPQMTLSNGLAECFA